MNKVIAVFFVVTMSLAYGQNFTWIRGSNLSADLGTRGTMGVASSSNDPSGRHGGANWVDNNGNLWTFGGEGYDSNANFGHIGDLWKYNPNTNQWTWMNGQDAVDYNGVYGPIGVPSSTIYPGSREFTAHWTDNSGNFWFFGGLGWAASSTSPVYLNDMWRYNPASNQWTYFGGSTGGGASGVYGTLGVASSSAIPGGRKFPAHWVDASGKFWMFGGFGFGASTFGNLNDLWMYNPATNLWTWMGGSQISNQNGVYGTLNVPSVNNIPGGRQATGCTQDNAGNFYLFGGLGYPAVGVGGYLNDLWKFNPNNLTWTWVSGTQSVNIPCNYGTLNQTSSATQPGGRYSPAIWKDGQNSIYLFGGRGQDLTTFAGDLNDLYKFDLSLNQWTWLKGSQNTFTTGVYGNMGVASPSNVPGSREYANFWPVQNGTKLWLLGGEGNDATNLITDHMNDLWLFEIPCKPDSVIGNLKTCSGNSVALTAHTNPSATINWYSSATSTTALYTGSLYTQNTTTTTTTTTLTVYTQYASCTLIPRSAVVITLNPLPNISVINPTPVCQGPNTFTSTGATSYTWNNGATQGSVATINLSPPLSTLTLGGTNNFGCSSTAQATVLVHPSPTLNILSSTPTLCANQSATLNVTGNATTYTWSNASTTTSVIVSPTVTTTYSVTGTLAGCLSTATFVQIWSKCTALEPNLALPIQLWPNPSTGILYIKSDESGTLEIYDAVGKLVFSANVHNGINQLLLNLPSGIYVCKMANNMTSKLIVE